MDTETWTGPSVKIVRDDWNLRDKDAYEVMVYGNPYRQVFRGSLNHCKVIAAAFIAVGYQDKTVP